MASADNAQRLPFWDMIESFVNRRIQDHLQMQPKNVPVTVTKVDKEFVYVQPDIHSTVYTFPTIKVAQTFSRNVREPTQVGDKGYIVAADYYVGGETAYSGGQADLYPRGNLTPLAFQPISSGKFSERNYNQTHVQGGPDGYHLESSDGKAFHDLDKDHIHTIQSDDKHLVTVDKKNKKITLQVPADSEHQIFLGGDGVTGTYALIPGSINVYIRTG